MRSYEAENPGCQQNYHSPFLNVFKKHDYCLKKPAQKPYPARQKWAYQSVSLHDRKQPDMNHKEIRSPHTKDCCSADTTLRGKDQAPAGHDHDGHDHDGHGHAATEQGSLGAFVPPLISLAMLVAAVVLDNWIPQAWFTGWIRVVFYVAAYAPVGLPVIREAIESIVKGDIFSEFFLMSIATIGAFCIGEYPEAVAVMLFYSVGEAFQGMALRRARSDIRSLLDQRPDEVSVLAGNQPVRIKAETAEIGQVIQLKPGEKVGLDGILLSDSAAFNTAALTGESVPDSKSKGDKVLAGMINLNTVSLVEVTARYTDSKLSKILELTQHATARKAPTELFIRKFARVYTPVVVLLAVMVCFLPALFTDDYQFSTWLYRALVFLVISCPCALVISIPLGYFGGIGAASRNGILVKGGNFLDKLAEIQNVVMDKTGTMTEGVFNVQEVVWNEGFSGEELLPLVNALESHSTHPVATAIRRYAGTPVAGSPAAAVILRDIEEIPGHGLKARAGDKLILAGNFRLMDLYNIPVPIDPEQLVHTVTAIAYDGRFAGYITIADEIKKGAESAIAQLHQLNVSTTMLSGDKSAVVRFVADKLGIQHAYGDLLPEDKVRRVEEIRSRNESIAFVGDGLNDAPVIALSDVGVAMGGLGSDATIETADVVIQDDKPGKIPMAIRIGKETRKIVWQNISFAFIVKALVLIMGAGGLATMWEAVFADVGVALIAILNATRIQQMKF